MRCLWRSFIQKLFLSFFYSPCVCVAFGSRSSFHSYFCVLFFGIWLCTLIHIACSVVCVCACVERLDCFFVWLQTGCGFLINRQWKMKNKKIRELTYMLHLLYGMDAPQPHDDRDVVYLLRTTGPYLMNYKQMFSGHSWHISFNILLFPYTFRFVWTICSSSFVFPIHLLPIVPTASATFSTLFIA